MTKQIITYSPAYTIVPTYECFNHCSYCNFRTDPQEDQWLDLTEAEKILKHLQTQEITEILILSGEVHPQSSRRELWFNHIYNLAHSAVNQGFFPHSNVGPLSFQEMAKLREVNVSMGLMLEQLSPKLMETVHRRAPSKHPDIRLQQLNWAGKLKIPFTTGILLGIGENTQDRIESLKAIAEIHLQWRHIQEVILQPYSVGSKEELLAENFNAKEMLATVAIAREILPDDITIQVPPNLIKNRQLLLECLALGCRDLGGIVPKDEVNPDYHHDDLLSLQEFLAPHDWQLQPRLPVYPHYYSWVSDLLQKCQKKNKGQSKKGKEQRF